MNGHVMGFHQLVQKLGHSKKQVTPNTSTFHEIQNEWSLDGFSSTGSKVSSGYEFYRNVCRPVK